MVRRQEAPEGPLRKPSRIVHVLTSKKLIHLFPPTLIPELAICNTYAPLHVAE